MDVKALALHLWDRWRFEAPAEERAWDVANGVETSRWTLGGYEPTPLTLGRLVLESLPRRGRTFVDIGCGKGRMLLLAAEAGFDTVVGVELDGPLYDTAVANTADRGIGVVNRDARAFPWPAGPLAIFMYNPFQDPILGQAIDHLEAALRADPRPVDLIYVNPLGLDAFLERRWRVLSDSGDGTGRWLHLRPDAFLCEPLRPPDAVPPVTG